MIFNNDQEEFWAGSFGNSYIGRNESAEYLASNVAFFSRILSKMDKIESCIEFGANVGMNLKALNVLKPNLRMSAVEINAEASRALAEFVPQKNVHNCSILDFSSKQQYDLVLIKGVLIHINPETLNRVYETLYSSCSKYLLVAEYYNPTPVAVNYRGHENRLFKRDFAGEILDQYKNMKLKDYGFVYRRDISFAQDDVTWMLLEKVSR